MKIMLIVKDCVVKGVAGSGCVVTAATTRDTMITMYAVKPMDILVHNASVCRSVMSHMTVELYLLTF